MTLAISDGIVDRDAIELRTRELQSTINRTILLGMSLIVLLFGFTGLWLTFAPLNSAAIANGQIVVATKRKTLQHLEGGIIREVLVKEGDNVEKGQVLMRLADTQVLALRNQVQTRLHANLALEARLIAERDNSATVAFDAETLDRASKDPEIRAVIDGQLSVFDTRRRAMSDQISVLEQRIAQANELIRGAESQVRARQVQARLLDEEIATVKELFDRGNALKPRLLALQRSRADTDSTLADLTAQMARARQQIGESRMQMLAMRSDRAREVVLELRETQNQLSDFKQRLKAADDTLDRLVLVAPEDGVVLGVRTYTVGGVIRGGDPVMDLVPRDDRMVVEAQLQANHIDVVHPGQEANVRLTAYKTRTTPTFKGIVTYVSPDRVVDNQGAAWYITRVEIDTDALKHYPEVKLYPGSPAEVMITTGERTALDYVLSPFTQSLRRSFRED